MVKIFISFVLLFTLGLGDEKISTNEDLLASKIRNFVGEDAYERKINFINVIFDPKDSFYDNDRVDVIKVVGTLEENGLLKLFFQNPQEVRLNFKTSGAPLFFVKLMGDALRNIGYYRYVTTASTLNSSEFIWNISMMSEYATNPLVLQNELAKNGCFITDIQRKSATDWTYTIDMRAGFLNLAQLEDSVKIKLKHSLYAHWLDCSKIEKLVIGSSRRNDWYPYVSYYDSSLHLLKVTKEDSRRSQITLAIPKRAKYMKISDLYTLKNVKDELSLSPYGRR
jgi:hypothetical protein